MARAPKSPDDLVQKWDKVFEAILENLDNGTGNIYVRVANALRTFEKMHGNLEQTSHGLPDEVFASIKNMYENAGWAEVKRDKGEKFGPEDHVTFIRQ